MTRGGITYYYQLNAHGDVTKLTDGNGVEVASYEYDAYGNIISETGTVENPYRYAGYRYDKLTGLYYLQARYYDAKNGRFITRDDFEGFESNPISLNRYTYAHNSPIIKIDPDGHHPIIIVGFIHVMRATYGAFLWAIISMWYANVRYGQKYTWAAFRDAFILGFICNLFVGYRVTPWLRNIAKSAGTWIAARFYSLAYYTVYRAKRKTVSYYAVYRIIRNILR